MHQPHTGAPSGTADIIKVVLADPHPAIREALARRLSTDLNSEICGECSTIAEALETTRTRCPDIVVMEVTFPDGSGLDFLKQAKSAGLQFRGLVFSSSNPEFYARRAIQEGAWGYVSKDCTTMTVVDAVRQICVGRRYLPTSVEEGSPKHDEPKLSVDSLSNRELSVFLALGDGLDMNEISRRLGLSVKTIETYRARIKQKLGIKSRANLIHIAVEWSITQRRITQLPPANQSGKQTASNA